MGVLGRLLVLHEWRFDSHPELIFTSAWQDHALWDAKEKMPYSCQAPFFSWCFLHHQKLGFAQDMHPANSLVGGCFSL